MASPGRLRGEAIQRGRRRADARRASRNREDYMATQGRNIIGDGRNVSRIREARADRTLNRPPRWDEKLGRDISGMATDLGTAAVSPFKTAWMRGADLFAQGLGSFSEAEKARVGGKFNAPLNVKKGTNAYGWLLDDVIKDKYEDDFKREVAKGNLSWTELNKFADDEYIGGGQLARGINTRNEGIAGTDIGTEFINEVVVKRPGDTEQINATIDRFLAPTATDADRLYYRSHPEQLVKLAEAEKAAKYAEGPRDKITITDIIEEPYGEEWDIDTGPYNLNPAVPISRQEGLDWDFDSERKMRLYQDQQEEKDARLMDILEDIGVTSPGGPIEGHVPPDPTIDELAGTGYPVVPPPFLSRGTDWFTPEPEEKEFIPRGLEELVMDQYGVDAPGVPREREWPNTPPPGMDRSWYEKYMAPWLNTGYDYYNE